MECSRANGTWIECTLSVWCCLLLCDGFPWVHLQVTGNTDGYMRSTLERFTNTLTQIASHTLADKRCTHKTQARSRTHTLCGNTALGDVLLFFPPLWLLLTQRLQKTRTWTVRGSTRQKALEVSGSVLCYRVETDNLSSSTRPLNNPVYKRMYVRHSFKYTVIYIYFFCIFI